MQVTHVLKIAGELNIAPKSVEATLELLAEGGTVPFISRYRKEATGSLDEVAITKIRDRSIQLDELDKRRESIIKSIKEQGKLTAELEAKISDAETMTVLEDLYLPYKPKRRTKATIAKEKGLEPLAELIFKQELADPDKEAELFVNLEKDVKDFNEALAGARDIIAEWVSENQEARGKLREVFYKQGTIRSRVVPGKEEEGQKYKDYFEFEEAISKVPSHRLLAMRRGEKEMFLMLDIEPAEESSLEVLEGIFVKGRSSASGHVKTAVKDSYKRLLRPSIETEVRLGSKKKADDDAIQIFAENLRQLLLAAPLGQKAVLSIDPGFRTGCKVVCLDRQGKLLANENIYPHEPQRKVTEAISIIKRLCETHQVEAIAVGNGTAGRETETFVRTIDFGRSIPVIMVNESGASIYSASDVAREEFPDYDVTVRGSVSIGRRLMDPLAELVKLDPKSIGVGQYQHDVDQNALKSSLDDVVISCVNNVGVEVNTASKQILTYVSGLGPQLAQNIIDYRNQNGAFKSRNELKKVPRMGEKAFEQAAGFLRINNGDNPLDASAVHPESYHIIDKMAKDLKASVADLMKKSDLRKLIDLKSYVTATIGLPTLQDILKEIEKPGRDPREKFEVFEFASGIEKPEDLRIGMKLPGIVTNITKFGVFVDVGVHQDGLIHISHLADKYVSDPSEVVKVHQKVEVTVIEVDLARKRIALSMKGNISPEGPKKAKDKKEPEKEVSFEDKLAMLKGKFKN
ncbi:MAG: RNA-binding transcriptional accessory protein [Sporocytophaga sp.]|uniref:Tex family protein n=1 Tax=Sporocytophaga sp. TaxID=2231183 RepID=UPI001B22D4B7|nr:Tex family protein [Sporocytophaga sp.]MBO9700632.1 RNA-binding transcriptional accessory protein [Sporocytophaga sp.]